MSENKPSQARQQTLLHLQKLKKLLVATTTGLTLQAGCSKEEEETKLKPVLPSILAPGAALSPSNEPLLQESCHKFISFNKDSYTPIITKEPRYEQKKPTQDPFDPILEDKPTKKKKKPKDEFLFDRNRNHGYDPSPEPSRIVSLEVSCSAVWYKDETHGWVVRLIVNLNSSAKPSVLRSISSSDVVVAYGLTNEDHRGVYLVRGPGIQTIAVPYKYGGTELELGFQLNMMSEPAEGKAVEVSIAEAGSK